jgi:hypothetical protein
VKPKSVTILLVVILVVSTIISYSLIDKTNLDWGFTFLGVIGSNASLLGIIFTLYQLNRIKAESVIIKMASLETKRKIIELENFGDLAHGVKLVQEIQGHIRSAKHEMAVARLQELKIIIGEVRGFVNLEKNDEKFDAHIQTLNLLISAHEKEIEQKKNSLRAAQINGQLEVITDFIVMLKKQLISRT